MALGIGQELYIGGVPYRIAEHPTVPGFPYGQEGRQAVVYQLLYGEERRAIKVFKAWYRRPAMVSLSESLESYSGLPGLQVCSRTVLTPQGHPELLRAQSELLYAVVMPWIQGPTWLEVMLTDRQLTPEQSLGLARSLVGALAAMEQRGLAHCDLSGANLLLPGFCEAERSNLSIALVDVEQLFGPGLDRPEALPAGSYGYAHRTATDGLWAANADRFAGAVLLAEILGWCDPEVREAAWGETYFDHGEMSTPSERYRVLLGVLERRWGGGAARLFEQAWRSEALADCATFGEWLMALPDSVPVISRGPGPAVQRMVQQAMELEEQGDVAGALSLYAEARAQVTPESSLAEELTLIIAELECPPAAPPVPEPAPPAAAVEVVSRVYRPVVGAILRERAGKVGLLRSLLGRPTAVTSLAFSPDGLALAAGSGDTTVWLLSTADWAPVHRLTGHTGGVTCLAFSPDGTLLAAGAGDNTVRVWDGNGELRGVLSGHAAAVTALAFSPEGSLVASASRDGTVCLWRVPDGGLFRTIQAHAGGALSLAFAPDGGILATGGYDGVRQWRTASGAAALTLKGQPAYARALAFSPDGEALVTGAKDALLRCWQPHNGALVRSLKGHTAQAESVQFSPDGSLLASGARDRSICLWDASGGALFNTLRGSLHPVVCVAFSPDGAQLASGSYEGVRLWGIR